MKRITAAVLIIGNEILSGKTREANMYWLTGQLRNIGIDLHECAVVRDDEKAIVDALNRLRKDNDYVFTSGGIGPTHDDITSSSVAAAFGTTIYRHPEIESLLLEYYDKQGITDIEGRMKMAEVPHGARLISNPLSTAPGFCMDNVYVMAGVPKIFQAMFNEVRKELKGSDIVKSVTFTAFAREGDIAIGLGELQDQYPEIEIGSYPFVKDGKFGTRLILTGSDEELLKECQISLSQLLNDKDIAFSL